MAVSAPHGPRLRGRRGECETLDRLVAGVRAGRSAGPVVRGEAGVGKSALLGYLGERAPGCGVARAAGVESEMELAYAGLHQLCAPLLDRLDRLPAPQRDAANGDNDIMVPTPNSRLLAEHLPNAELSIFPGAGHGFLFQYPVQFADDVNAFLG